MNSATQQSASGRVTHRMPLGTGARFMELEPATLESVAEGLSREPFVEAAFAAVRLVQEGSSLVLEIDCDGERSEDEAVARLILVTANLAQLRLAPVGAGLGQGELVSEEERIRLLGFNEVHPIGDQLSVLDLFADCVKRFPTKPAVEYQGSRLTFGQLSRRVDALARCLVRDGVKVGDRVAIQLAPSLETTVAMLGVLRAGGIYLPIDRELPPERVRYMLEDSGAVALIGNPKSRGLTDRIVDLDDLDYDTERDGTVVLPQVRGHDGAYLIYTSGTTGMPKGVLIEHHSLVAYVSWFRERYRIDSSHVAVLLTSYAFDLGYTTLWTMLLSGGCLHVVPDALCEDPGAVARYFRQHRITFIKVTPSLLGALVASRELDGESGSSLRLVVTGGERIRAHDLVTLYERCPNVLVVNHYGPTETTIGVMTCPIPRESLGGFARRPVIGRPIGNAKAYITTRDQRLLPIGVAGELLIGGCGVARGYHQRDELTRERFIPDPFATTGRVYRTGDLARWTEDGTVEFLGRIDRQVKIRGYRVELGEIEQVMVKRLDIREVVVVDRVLGASNRVLCAYHVGALDHADARERLAQMLPEYMVPTYFIEVVGIPRTANGKLDTKALPEPQFAATDGVDAPRNETERCLLAMWAEVFGIEAGTIGVSRSFLDLGGHSLLMIQLIAEIDNRFGRTIPFSTFNPGGSIRAIAKLLDARETA